MANIAIAFPCNCIYFLASGLVLFVASVEDLFICSAPDDRKMMQCIPFPEEIVS